MALPYQGSSISMNQIHTEFYGSPPSNSNYRLSNKYTGNQIFNGTFGIPNRDNLGNTLGVGTPVKIPSSGTIRFSDFFGSSNFQIGLTNLTDISEHYSNIAGSQAFINITWDPNGIMYYQNGNSGSIAPIIPVESEWLVSSTRTVNSSISGFYFGRLDFVSGQQYSANGNYIYADWDNLTDMSLGKSFNILTEDQGGFSNGTNCVFDLVLYRYFTYPPSGFYFAGSWRYNLTVNVQVEAF